MANDEKSSGGCGGIIGLTIGTFVVIGLLSTCHPSPPPSGQNLRFIQDFALAVGDFTLSDRTFTLRQHSVQNTGDLASGNVFVKLNAVPDSSGSENNARQDGELLAQAKVGKVNASESGPEKDLPMTMSIPWKDMVTKQVRLRIFEEQGKNESPRYWDASNSLVLKFDPRVWMTWFDRPHWWVDNCIRGLIAVGCAVGASLFLTRGRDGWPRWIIITLPVWLALVFLAPQAGRLWILRSVASIGPDPSAQWRWLLEISVGGGFLFGGAAFIMEGRRQGWLRATYAGYAMLACVGLGLLVPLPKGPVRAPDELANPPAGAAVNGTPPSLVPAATPDEAAAPPAGPGPAASPTPAPAPISGLDADPAPSPGPSANFAPVPTPAARQADPLDEFLKKRADRRANAAHDATPRAKLPPAVPASAGRACLPCRTGKPGLALAAGNNHPPPAAPRDRQPVGVWTAHPPKPFRAGSERRRIQFKSDQAPAQQLVILQVEKRRPQRRGHLQQRGLQALVVHLVRVEGDDPIQGSFHDQRTYVFNQAGHARLAQLVGRGLDQVAQDSQLARKFAVCAIACRTTAYSSRIPVQEEKCRQPQLSIQWEERPVFHFAANEFQADFVIRLRQRSAQDIEDRAADARDFCSFPALGVVALDQRDFDAGDRGTIRCAPLEERVERGQAAFEWHGARAFVGQRARQGVISSSFSEIIAFR